MEIIKAIELLLQCGDLMAKINRGIDLNQCFIFEGLGYLGPETWTSLETKAQSTVKGKFLKTTPLHSEHSG